MVIFFLAFAISGQVNTPTDHRNDEARPLAPARGLQNRVEQPSRPRDGGRAPPSRPLFALSTAAPARHSSALVAPHTSSTLGGATPRSLRVSLRVRVRHVPC